MPSMTEFVSPIEANQRRREGMQRVREENELRAKAAEEAAADLRAFGSSDQGLEIRKTYQERFDGLVKKWLKTETHDPAFPTLSIALHAELKMVRRLLDELSPKQETQDGD